MLRKKSSVVCKGEGQLKWGGALEIVKTDIYGVNLRPVAMIKGSGAPPFY